MFDHVYELSKQEVRTLYRTMAENYVDDDLYKKVFPNDEVRLQAVERFFRYYLKAVEPFSYFFADSKAMNTIMVVYDERLNKRLPFLLHFGALNLKLPMFLKELHRHKDWLHALKCYDMFTSHWVKDFENGDYLHLDLIYTRKEARHLGYSKGLMKALSEYAKREQLDITLETHNKNNVSYYERFGFKLMKTLTNEELDLSQYCMMKKWEEDKE